jgi:hypothetical protein
VANDKHFRIKNGLKVGDVEVISASGKLSASSVTLGAILLSDFGTSTESTLSSLSAALGTYEDSLTTLTLIEEAQESASASLSAILNSEGAASDAKAAAVDAKLSASAASVNATNFKNSAEDAKSDALAAATLSQTYRENASAARTAALSAKGAAENAQSDALVALNSANLSSSAASAAKVSAQTAKSLAENAKSDANAAAVDADAYADNALSDALAAFASFCSAFSSKLLASTEAATAESKAALAATAFSSASVAAVSAIDAKNLSISAQGVSEGAASDALVAKVSASASQVAALSALTTASNAAVSAVSAETLSISAQGGAEAAASDAQVAQTNAEASEVAALSAFATASDAAVSAVAAETLSISAQGGAEAAASDAQVAQTNAEASEVAALSAFVTASNAAVSAVSAESLSISAQGGAEASASDAEVAKVNAEASEVAALSAFATASDAAVSAVAAETLSISAQGGAEASASDANVAKISASASQVAALSAFVTASNAAVSAVTAETLSISAQGGAEAAASDAQVAKISASASQVAALSAFTTASNAAVSAVSAESLSISAQGGAEAAASDAQVAKASASSFQAAALSALVTASNAAVSAVSAEALSISAQGGAEAAASDAQAAQANASIYEAGALSAFTTASNAAVSAVSAETLSISAQGGAEASASDANVAKLSASASKVAALSAFVTASNAAVSAVAAETLSISAQGGAEGAASDALVAKASASSLQLAALSAFTTASNAAVSAVSAESLSISAQGGAEAAASDAQAAQANAGIYEAAALSAFTTASNAAVSAVSAETLSISAQGGAEAAASDALVAKVSASASQVAALSAFTTASNAAVSAVSAETLSISAQGGAEAAASDAEVAKISAEGFQAAALSAFVTASNAAVSAESAEGLAISARGGAQNAESDAQAAFNLAEIELAALNPARVGTNQEAWAYNAFDNNLDTTDSRFTGTDTFPNGSFVTDDTTFGNAFLFPDDINKTFGPRKSFPFASDKVYLMRVRYRTVQDSDTSYGGQFGVRCLIGTTTRGANGVTLAENIQDFEQRTLASLGEVEFVGVVHGEDYADASLDSLPIIDATKTTNQDNSITDRVTTTQTASPNAGHSTPATSISFAIRQNAGGVTDGQIAVKSFEVIDITDIVKTQLQTVSAQNAASDALVAQANAETYEAAALSAFVTASNAAVSAVSAESLSISARGGAQAAASDAQVAQANAEASEVAALSAFTTASNAAVSAVAAETLSISAQGGAEAAASDAQVAQANAEASEVAALSAFTTASNAAVSAVSAESLSISAQGGAEAAASDAQVAKIAASASQVAALSAFVTASNAAVSAVAAETLSISAQGGAEAAASDAEVAKAGADNARIAALSALVTASNAAVSAVSAESLSISAQGAAEAAASDANVAKVSASASQVAALSAKVTASSAAVSATNAETLAVSAQGVAENAASGASNAEVTALSAKVTASGAAASALEYEETALAASNCSQDAADAAIISAQTASAQASSIGALTSQVQDVRAIEARVNNGNNGHYVGSDWWLEKIDGGSVNDRVKINPVSDGGAIYIDKFTRTHEGIIPADAGTNTARWTKVYATDGFTTRTTHPDTSGHIPEELVLTKNVEQYAVAYIDLWDDGDATYANKTLVTKIIFGSTLDGTTCGVYIGNYQSVLEYSEIYDKSTGNIKENTEFTFEYNVPDASSHGDQEHRLWLLTDDEISIRYIDIRVKDKTDSISKSTYTVTTNASSASTYQVTSADVNTEGDFHRIYSTSPFIAYNRRGSMAIPRNFADTRLGVTTRKYHPWRYYIYSPYSTTKVDVYAHVSGDGVVPYVREGITPPTTTLHIPKGGMVEWNSDYISHPYPAPQDENDVPGPQKVRVVFVSRGAKILGHIDGDNFEDDQLMPLIPLSNTEIVGSRGYTETSGYNFNQFEDSVGIMTGGGINLGSLINLIEAEADGELGAANAPILQQKIQETSGGFAYADLSSSGSISFADAALVEDYRDGIYVTTSIYERIENLIARLETVYDDIESTFTYDGVTYTLFDNTPVAKTYTNVDNQYATVTDPRFYMALSAFYDGSAPDQTAALPRGSLSDLYTFYGPAISHFIVTAVQPCSVTVTNKDGETMYELDLTAASTTNPISISRGKARDSIVDIGNGKGPFTFTGTAPFYVSAQDLATKLSTTLLGAKQGILSGEIQQTATATQVSSIQSSVDDAVATVTETAESIDGLEAQYSVKINNNGNVSGFGLASSNVSSATSAFVVQADRFAIVAPTGEDLDLTPEDANSIPFDVSGGLVTIKNAFIKNLTSENIRGSSITGDNISATTRIQVYTPGNKEATYAALDGVDPLYRIYAGSQNPGAAPFAVTTKGDVVADSLHFRGYKGAYFDSEYGLGLAALTDISNYVKQGRKGVTSGTVVGDFDEWNPATVTSVTLFDNKYSSTNSNVYQRYRIPVNKFSINKRFDYYSKEVAPFKVGLGTLGSGDPAFTIGESGQSVTYLVQVPQEGIDASGNQIYTYSNTHVKNRRYRSGELLKIEWSGDIGVGASLVASGFRNVDGNAVGTISIGPGTPYPNSIIIKADADLTYFGFTIIRPGSGNIIYSIPNYGGSTITETIVGTVATSARALIPSSISMKPKRMSLITYNPTAFMSNTDSNNPWDANGKLTFTAIESDDDFSTDDLVKPYQYRVITSPELIDNVSIQASSHIDWRVTEETGGVIDGFLTGHTTTFQVSLADVDNSLPPDTYLYGSDNVYEDAQGNDIADSYLTLIETVVETEILGFYDEFYVEADRKVILENDVCTKLVTTMANSYITGGGTAYGIPFYGNSFYMVENDFRQADLDLGLQALILGNVGASAYAPSSRHNLFVIATRPDTDTDYTSKLHLTEDGNLYVGSNVTTPVAGAKVQTKWSMSSYFTSRASNLSVGTATQALKLNIKDSNSNTKVDTSYDSATEIAKFNAYANCNQILFTDYYRGNMLGINGPNNEVRIHAGTTVFANTTNCKITSTQMNIPKIVTSGDVIIGGAVVADGNVTAFSDERLKSDIKTLDGKKVLEMRGVEFIKGGEKGSGVIAQELEKIAPELVSNKEEYKSVAYGNLVGYLIEAIKDQQKQIDYLKEVIENGSSK